MNTRYDHKNRNDRYKMLEPNDRATLVELFDDLYARIEYLEKKIAVCLTVALSDQ